MPALVLFDLKLCQPSRFVRAGALTLRSGRCRRTIGMLAHKRFPNHGLLPTFELDCAANVVAWNRVRLYLQTYKKSSFSKQQLIVTFVSAINVVLLVAVFVSTFFDPSAGSASSSKAAVTAAESSAGVNATGAATGAAAAISRGKVGIFLLQVATRQTMMHPVLLHSLCSKY